MGKAERAHSGTPNPPAAQRARGILQCAIASLHERNLQCAIASLLERKRGKRGAPEGCVRLSQGQPYGRPARGDIEAQSTAYPCLAPRLAAMLTTPGFHPRRVLEDPRGRIALLLPAESGRGLATPPVCVPPGLPQAPHPFPTWRDGPGHASLMGKRRAQCNGGARRGDKEGGDSAAAAALFIPPPCGEVWSLVLRAACSSSPLGERACRRDLARDALERRLRKAHGGKGEGEMSSIVSFKAPSPDRKAVVLSPRGEESRASSPGTTSTLRKGEDERRLVLEIGGDLAAIGGELDHHLLVQPDIHLGRILGVAGVMQLLGELLARGLARVRDRAAS